MNSPVIFHIDVNAAFLSWEAAYRTHILGEAVDLRDIPSAVGGDIQKRKGIILAKSIPAKSYHIITGEPVTNALSKCPHLKLVKPNYSLYVQCSKALMSLLKEYTPFVEQYSIDEAYMDMTGTEGLYGSPLTIASVIKDRIHKELGFTVNIGVSSNKLLAKMASDFKKPNLVHTLFPEEIEEKMWPLKIGELFFVGKAAEKTLKMLGIDTIGKLAKADINLIKAHLKKQGEIIYQYAKGIDQAPLQHRAVPNKGYGNSTTISFDVSSAESAKLVLLSLCETICTRLRADYMKAGCVSVTLTNTYFESASHQKTLSCATHITSELYHHACSLFDALWDHKTPIRQLGVHTSSLTDSKAYQYNLFDSFKYDRYEKLDAAVDCIRNKYGEDSVKRASFLNSKLDHMAGGISKEKKTGITKLQL